MKLREARRKRTQLHRGTDGQWRADMGTVKKFIQSIKGSTKIEVETGKRARASFYVYEDKKKNTGFSVGIYTDIAEYEYTIGTFVEGMNSTQVEEGTSAEGWQLGRKKADLMKMLNELKTKLQRMQSKGVVQSTADSKGGKNGAK